MQSVLMVSKVNPGQDFLSSILPLYDKLYTSNSAAAARAMLLERDIDLVIINAPLADETGEQLAKDIATATQVILIVNAQYYDEISTTVEELGIITIAKPINKKMLTTSVKIAYATNKRLKRLEDENISLSQKIDDIRIVSRAKCILIELRGITETEAHKYIEKQAMNLRKTRKDIAQTIIANHGW